MSLVDTIRITYTHSFIADNDELSLMAESGQQVSVSGFTGKGIRVLDITDSESVQEITASVTEEESGYRAMATPGGTGDRLLLMFADTQTRHPEKVAANIPSSLRQPGNGADLLILTERGFFGALEPLKALRQKEGLSVAVVDIEDIYDEFSFGNKTVQAVKDFLSYAASRWKRPARYVLLGGDASYDARNYLGLGSYDLVPTRQIDTQYLETASDDWLADFNEDGIAELAVGRLPFRNVEEATTMIEKIIGYEQSPASGELLLVSDSNDGYNFEQASRELAGIIPSRVKVNQINRGQIGTEKAKEEMMEAINRGQKLVNYVGHGSVTEWRGNLLENEDAAQMKNRDHLSVFVMMTCLNGYFDDPGLESLGEALMKAERGGAVAVWASSGTTMPGGQALINRQLYLTFFGRGGAVRLGEATRAAKEATTDLDIRRTWILIGDPTMRLR